MIRRATPEDAPAIHALKLAAFGPYRERYTPACFDATVLDDGRIQDRMAEGPVWVWDDGDIQGTVGARRDQRGLYVRGMAVHPDAQGKGIGKALLDACRNYAVDQEIPCMWLSTTLFLDASARLYERYGFRPSHGPAQLEGTDLRSYECSV
ncbi:MAG: GNAT family N-acetyltransferase [Thermoplasmatota archaeon]